MTSEKHPGILRAFEIRDSGYAREAGGITHHRLYCKLEPRCVVETSCASLIEPAFQCILASVRVPAVDCCARSIVAIAAAGVVAAFGRSRAGIERQPRRLDSLGVNLLFPDDGLVADEQLCVALFPSTDPDVSRTTAPLPLPRSR